MRILLVEDDEMFGEATKAGLEQEAYAVDWVQQIEAARAALFSHDYDIILLDIGLPDGEGTDLLKELRERRNGVPVLIMTARDALNDKIGGLDKGADDYLVKPFDLHELYARMRAIGRRKDRGSSVSELICGDLRLDAGSLKAWYQGGLVDLGPKEFRILEKLIEKKGKIVSREKLQDLLYSWDNEIESNAIEVHMHRLRKKIDKSFIKTVRGVGYMIEEKQ